jgi:S1-C subfamily serine protease
MMQRFFVVLFGVAGCAVSSLAANPNANSPNPPSTPAVIRRSLVRITTTSQDPDYKVPWTPGNIGGGVGAGFVIDGQRIMTNAHVVSNARFLSIEKENDPKKYVATVQFVGHDCDLAVLKVADPNFFKNTVPLNFGGIPQIESTVSVFGYPIGGERLSVTQGIVSRVDFLTYTHSLVDAHLAIQIDAAINPGNSGGPVLQEGKVVGVAFQGYSGEVAQNVGYMIPVPVIQRFLKDISDGHYDRYMDLSVSTFNLQNPAQRHALGLGDDDRGVMVSSVASAGCAAGILQVGDVLLSIDDHPIASDSFVELEGERVPMAEVVERKFKGDSVALHILRDKKEMDVTIKLDTAWPFMMQANQYDVEPRYVLFGGLLFQPLSRDFLEANPVDDLRVHYFYDYFAVDELYRDHPEIIILSAILQDPINTYLGEFKNGIVDEINGKKIKTLNDMAEEFQKPANEYVLKLIGVGRPIVLERTAVEAARERIKTRYNVVKEENLKE